MQLDNFACLIYIYFPFTYVSKLLKADTINCLPKEEIKKVMSFWNKRLVIILFKLLLIEIQIILTA